MADIITHNPIMSEIKATLNHILHSLTELSIRINKPSHTPSVQPINAQAPLSLPPPSNLTTPSISPSKPTLPSSYAIKRLTYSKIQQLRDLGLCLNCNDIDTPDHCCSIKRILLIMPDEDPTIEQQSMETVKPAVPKTLHFQTAVVNCPVVTLVNIEKQPLELFQPIVPEQLTGQEFSLHTLIRSSNLKVTQLPTSFYGQQAAALILGNGKKMKYKGFCCKDYIFFFLSLVEYKIKLGEIKVLIFDPGGILDVKQLGWSLTLRTRSVSEGMVMIQLLALLDLNLQLQSLHDTGTDLRKKAQEIIG